MLEPINAAREMVVSPASEVCLHFVVRSIPELLIRHLFDRQTKKGAAKKIQELLEREAEKDKIYFDGLKAYANRKKT